MGSSGTRQIVEGAGVLIARAILALFVAWGSIVEMTRAIRLAVLCPRSPLLAGDGEQVHPYNRESHGARMAASILL